jgi:hypothetical protein
MGGAQGRGRVPTTTSTCSGCGTSAARSTGPARAAQLACAPLRPSEPPGRAGRRERTSARAGPAARGTPRPARTALAAAGLLSDRRKDSRAGAPAMLAPSPSSSDAGVAPRAAAAARACCAAVSRGAGVANTLLAGGCRQRRWCCQGVVCTFQQQIGVCGAGRWSGRCSGRQARAQDAKHGDAVARPQRVGQLVCAHVRISARCPCGGAAHPAAARARRGATSSSPAAPARRPLLPPARLRPVRAAVERTGQGGGAPVNTASSGSSSSAPAQPEHAGPPALPPSVLPACTEGGGAHGPASSRANCTAAAHDPPRRHRSTRSTLGDGVRPHAGQRASTHRRVYFSPTSTTTPHAHCSWSGAMRS